MNTRVTIMMAALLTLSGCATMNQEECLTSDWRTIGYEDGARGSSADRVGQHRKACAEYGVTPDLQAYQSGREDGLRQYCQVQNGFNLGSRGGSYAGVCPADLEPDFVAAYHAGLKLHDLSSKVTSTEGQIAYKTRELEKLADDLRAKEAVLISGATTAEERAYLLSETKDMARRQGELEAEILELERRKAVYQDQLAAYRDSLTYRL